MFFSPVTTFMGEGHKTLAGVNEVPSVESWADGSIRSSQPFQYLRHARLRSLLAIKQDDADFDGPRQSGMLWPCTMVPKLIMSNWSQRFKVRFSPLRTRVHY